ncbi:hypothetical protein [Bacillus sp. T33-2]|uniref:hypothetical protein n=1 Tax=Bacillus sp. T33-2 TaxID=2054168 RepID=UPI000C7831AD|nr:hypothetical protein [Bacillus sp. T33-2]PLR97411.1 hypothetical protein CVD19_07940 [Bacillus sp. T33-2]
MQQETLNSSLKERCTVICAIVLAAVCESPWFTPSRSVAKGIFPSLKNNLYSHKGIFVRIHQNSIEVTFCVHALEGISGILDQAKQLQQTIHEEIYHFTGCCANKIDIMIDGFIM